MAIHLKLNFSCFQIVLVKNTIKETKVTKYTGQLVDNCGVPSNHLRGNLVDDYKVNLVDDYEVNKRRKERSKERRNHRRKDGMVGGRK